MRGALWRCASSAPHSTQLSRESVRQLAQHSQSPRAVPHCQSSDFLTFVVQDAPPAHGDPHAAPDTCLCRVIFVRFSLDWSVELYVPGRLRPGRTTDLATPRWPRALRHRVASGPVRARPGASASGQIRVISMGALARLPRRHPVARDRRIAELAASNTRPNGSEGMRRAAPCPEPDSESAMARDRSRSGRRSLRLARPRAKRPPPDLRGRCAERQRPQRAGVNENFCPATAA